MEGCGHGRYPKGGKGGKAGGLKQCGYWECGEGWGGGGGGQL